MIGAMTGSRARLPIWGMRSAIRLSAMSCNATLYRPHPTWIIADHEPAGSKAWHPIASRFWPTLPAEAQSAGLDERAKLIDSGYAVAQRQRAELFAPAIEEWIIADHEPAGLQSDQVFEDCIEVAFGACVQDTELQAQRAGRRLQISCLNITTGKSRVEERG